MLLCPLKSVRAQKCYVPVENKQGRLTRHLDAESRKLRALESRVGPGLSAFERSEDATKGALMRVVSMDAASNLFRAMATRARNSNSVHLKWRTSAAFSLESRARGLGRTSTTGSPLPVTVADRWGTPPNVSEPLRLRQI